MWSGSTLSVTQTCWNIYNLVINTYTQIRVPRNISPYIYILHATLSQSVRVLIFQEKKKKIQYYHLLKYSKQPKLRPAGTNALLVESFLFANGKMLHSYVREAFLQTKKYWQFSKALKRQSQLLSSALSSASYFKSHFCKHCLPVCKNRFEKFARIFSRRHKQTTFSDAGFRGALRVKH